MPIDLSNIPKLVELLGKIDPPIDGKPIWSTGSDIKAETLSALLSRNAAHLPIAYRLAFIEPLTQEMGRILLSSDRAAEIELNVNTLVGAVIQHDPEHPLRNSVRQFLAVVSNYYRSFLAVDKRKTNGFPDAIAGLPPLVVFQHDEEQGPFIFPSNVVARLCGSTVSVVSLPERLSGHPIWWITLAHETVGHNVLHADTDLLPELAMGVRLLFSSSPLPPGRKPNPAQLLSLLWSHWLEEVVSDIYAVLNSGPAFAYNLAIYLSAIRGAVNAMDELKLESWQPLPVHPPLQLRLHALIGVVESLSALGEAQRSMHSAALHKLAREKAPARFAVRGRLEIERDRWIEIDRSVSFQSLARSAQRVGGYVVTAKLQSFGRRSVQEIETWDDDDERIASLIAEALAQDKQGGGNRHLGDDAQLLAGATLAIMKAPLQYENVTARLRVALMDSFRRDPIVGFPSSRGAH